MAVATKNCVVYFLYQLVLWLKLCSTTSWFKQLTLFSHQVDKRCGSGEYRLASNRQCISSNYPCISECSGVGGRLDRDLGVCRCNNYTDPFNLCDADCRECKPTTAIQNIDEEVYVIARDCMGEILDQSKLNDVFGLNAYDSTEHMVQVVEHTSNGIMGKFPTRNSEAIAVIPNSSTRRRRAVEIEEIPAIANPLICLGAGEAVAFTITVGDNTSTYHFPVYIKDHLLNSNPDFDYGAYRQLGDYLDSSVLVSTFVAVFNDPGTYVFRDSIIETSIMIVVVTVNGTLCERNDNDFRVLPASPSYLNSFGIEKTASVNQEPDFTAILAVFATAIFIVTVMVLAIFIWKPSSSGIEVPSGLKPKYRHVDDPKVVYLSGNPNDLDTLEKRGVAVGASAETRRSESFELENFNVRTLYDKLEDQTLHVSAQLAKQEADLRAFYDRISQQTEGLKSMVSEAAVLSNVEKSRKFQVQHPTATAAIVERGEPVGSEAPNTSLFGQGASRHETELMAVLKDLLSNTVQPRRTGMVVPEERSLSRAGLSRRWALERRKLEKELSQDEITAISEAIQMQVQECSPPYTCSLFQNICNSSRLSA